jgi:hypothetical protein
MAVNALAEVVLAEVVLVITLEVFGATEDKQVLTLLQTLQATN